MSQHSAYPTTYSTPSVSSATTAKIPAPEKERFAPEKYTKPYLDFMTNNPTVFHAVDYFERDLRIAGYTYLSEREGWEIKKGGKYWTKRNGSAIIAFAVGKNYRPVNGVAIVAGHIDALTAKVKPIPKLQTKAGFMQLGVAPYAGGMNSTWWDRDLGIGGKVIVKNENGKIEEKLVKLDWPIARIPTLAPHFGAAAMGPFNKETQMTPIIGLDNSDITGQSEPSLNLPVGTFVATQPERLVRAIAGELGIQDYTTILNWELELFDVQPAQLGGLDKEFIFAGRIDDKLCCFAAIRGLIESSDESSDEIIRMVGCFDNEEVGSQTRQGAQSDFMHATISRIVEARNEYFPPGPSLINVTLANSFLVSSDVIHAVNPNFLGAYLENHSPRLNVGVAVSADPNGHMTTDSVSTALLSRVAEKCGSKLQVFQIRNDSRSGGTIGPMTSSRLGCRAIDCGIPQLSMHSIRATTGSLDPGLGVQLYKGFFDYYQSVDAEFRD
jgi:aminopeptidase I